MNQSLSELQKTIQSLREQIEYHDKRYYQQSLVEITDQEYDRLKREYADLLVASGEDSAVGSTVTASRG